MKLRKCTREEFLSAISDNHADNFARTFVAKADMQEQWDDCWGAYSDDDQLMAAIITTVSRGKVANLQLLHTFAAHRGKGAAKNLCEDSLRQVKKRGAKFFRVSSEPESVGFYEKIGFKFWGMQKSGCQLSIFRITSTKFAECEYDYNDTEIRNAIHRKGKGGCVTLFNLATDQQTPTLEGF